MRDLVAAAGVVRYVALRDGVIADGGSFCMAECVAQLTGAATVPAHRRRGVQTALLSARLGDAAAAGCDLAVTTTHSQGRSLSRTLSASGIRVVLYPRRSGEAALSPHANTGRPPVRMTSRLSLLFAGAGASRCASRPLNLPGVRADLPGISVCLVGVVVRLLGLVLGLLGLLVGLVGPLLRALSPLVGLLGLVVRLLH